jgi:hypothetical protein
VAVLAGNSLWIYVDHVATNLPVNDARVDVASGEWVKQAKAEGPGIFSVPADFIHGPGRYPLTVSVQAAQVSDILAADLSLDDTVFKERSRWIRHAAYAAGGVALLLGIAAPIRARWRGKGGRR